MSEIHLKISNLLALNKELRALTKDVDLLYRVEGANSWFVPENVIRALNAICDAMLIESKLQAWIDNYPPIKTDYSLGLILAGNIPLVGFHDILCAYMSPARVKIKLSSKDAILTSKVLEIWKNLDENWASRLEFVDRIIGCEKIIATGSNTTFQYFEQYFSKYKSILRKNRSSIGIIHKEITDTEIDSLCDDIFAYFGLGCRNVSKLMIEKGFDLARIFEASDRKYLHLFEHSKYMNNYDYQRTLLLLNNITHLSNNFLMLREDSALFTPISVVNYEWFETKSEYMDSISSNLENIQCVIGKDFIPFGNAQSPELTDYADGVDVMKFLSE